MHESSQSTFPMGMKRIMPPEGTTLYKIGHSESQFGVQEIAHGRIRTFHENPGEPTDYTEGTFISFGPGAISAHVTRRELSANDINSIGAIVKETVNLEYLLRYLPEAIKDADDLMDKLRRMQSYSGHSSEVENLDEEGEKTLESLGTIISKLKNQLQTQRERYYSVIVNAGKLGISLFEMTSTGLRNIPVALIVKNEIQPPEESLSTASF